VSETPEQAVRTFLKQHFEERCTDRGAVYRTKPWIQIDWLLNLVNSQIAQATKELRKYAATCKANEMQANEELIDAMTENLQLRKALLFYADENNWNKRDKASQFAAWDRKENKRANEMGPTFYPEKMPEFKDHYEFNKIHDGGSTARKALEGRD
jgi:hypothetical protein